MKNAISNWGNEICPKFLISFSNVSDTLERSVEQILYDNISLLIQSIMKR